VVIEYQGLWDGISLTEERSKSTLGPIQALLHLQLSEPEQGGLLFSRPVGF
jgi:hypothetical protein